MVCVQVLEKTFYMENPDEVVPEKFVGCTIDWAAGKDTTGETRARGSCAGSGRGRGREVEAMGGRTLVATAPVGCVSSSVGMAWVTAHTPAWLMLVVELFSDAHPPAQGL